MFRVMQSQIDTTSLRKMTDILHDGGVMVYPTDTVAGIGSIGSDDDAVQRVFKLKQRSLGKPVSYAFSSTVMIERYGIIEKQYRSLLDLLPGPLTLIVPRRQDSPAIGGVMTGSIGVRIPAIDWFIRLVERLGEPVITTSANISGQPTARKVGQVPRSIREELDILVEWEGELTGHPSTVVSLVNGYEVVREGAIASDKLAKHLSDVLT